MAHLAAQYVPLEIPKLENLMLRKKKGGGDRHLAEQHLQSHETSSELYVQNSCAVGDKTWSTCYWISFPECSTDPLYV